ncbi:MAG TPA: hypothetical protein VI685_05155 [Candidatus Angelobacter sp.]
MTLIGQIRNSLRISLKLTTSFITAALVAVTLICLLIAWRDGIALLGALVGTALGWGCGILLAPYKEEQKRFQRLSKGIAGFLGGYAAGKIDRVFDLLTDRSTGPPLLLNPHVLRSFWMALASLLITAITVFVARTYWQAVEE